MTRSSTKAARLQRERSSAWKSAPLTLLLLSCAGVGGLLRPAYMRVFNGAGLPCRSRPSTRRRASGRAQACTSDVSVSPRKQLGIDSIRTIAEARPALPVQDRQEELTKEEVDRGEVDVVDPLPGRQHICTLIYLHGHCRRGSEYGENGPLSFCMPWISGGDRAWGLRAVLPTARDIRQPWGDLEPSWYGYMAENRNHVGDLRSLRQTRDRLGQLVREEVERLGGDGRRVFLGGASQGCTVALDVYLREASSLQLGGFVGSIGFMPSDRFGFIGATKDLDQLMADTEQAKMPIWLQCAVDDRHAVPWRSVVRPSLRRAEGKLRGLAIRQVAGRGHDIEEWEAHIVNDFMRAYASEMYTFT